MKKYLIAFCLLVSTFASLAQGLQANVFAQALKEGQASAPVPTSPSFDAMVKALQQKTGDPGPIWVNAYRILRFRQQAHCGRVGFVVSQPSTGKSWRDLGGQLNVCEGGTPPWRICASRPDVLVPPDSKCEDKSKTKDTPEISAAIEEALKGGSLSHEEVLKRMTVANNSKTTKAQGTGQ